MPDATLYFPTDFLWGTATAAHQVEGENSQNDWWRWEQEGAEQGLGRVFENGVSGKACDWWAGKAEEDIARMAELKNNTHRLSIEWSRIEPEQGKWDHDALDRYREILTAMREAGIKPMVTLHHFTNPLWMADQGGWANPQVPEWFVRYVKKATGDLSDLCDLWCTINEPNVYASYGYFTGFWPPGQTNLKAYFQVVYHMLQAHVAAYEMIHDIQPRAKVGLAKHMVVWYPRSRSPLDRFATRLLDRAFNALTLDALAAGLWRPLLGRRLRWPEAKGKLDWIGLNYYQRYDVSFSLKALRSLGIRYAARPGRPKGPGGWGEIYPPGLSEHLRRLHKQFDLPIYVTENGLPDEFDTHRPGFILESLRQIWAVVNHNCPVMGYYFWSLLDNFEWAEGYDPRFRFGLYGVDFETQERKLRKSGELYAEIAGTGSLSSDMARRYAPEVVDKMFPGKGPDRT